MHHNINDILIIIVKTRVALLVMICFFLRERNASLEIELKQLKTHLAQKKRETENEVRV